MLGMLLHIDGSEHRWFSMDRCLLFIDPRRCPQRDYYARLNRRIHPHG